MAGFMNKSYFVLLMLLNHCLCQTEIESNEDISKCSCDLTANGCDVNCCCDPECDDEDRLAFSECVDEYTPTDERMCVQEEVIFRDNTKFTSETTDNGLFCIDRDNYEKRNYYEVPNFVETQSKFDEYRDRYGGYNFINNPAEFPFSTEDYKSGDPVMTVYESGAVSYLGQPAPLTSGDCKDSNPVAFLYSDEEECVRPFIDSLEIECESNLALNAAVYYQGYKVLSSPQAFVEYPPGGGETSTESPVDSTTTDFIMTTDDTPVGVAPLYNSSFAVTIEPTRNHLCIDRDGLNYTCPFTQLPSPSWDPNEGLCSFAVIKVLYTLYWDGSLGINRTLVTFAFKNLTESDVPLTQAFQTDFLKAGEEDAVSVSGNPGYVVGLPVLAGDLTENQDSSANQRLAIDLSTDLSQRISLVTSRADGQCVDEMNNRVAVNFGVNMRSGCFLRVYYNNISDVCTLLQDQARVALLGNNPPTHVATFGDSSVQETGDWVEVLTDDVTSASEDGPDGCANMVTGLHWEIMYSNAGAIGNAQAKIIGATYRFTTQRIRFQCYGVYCQQGSEGASQMIEVVSSVGFIDASEKAVGESAERPQLNARLPADFFYPFS